MQHRATACEALYILGDFFEVWIGDDAISPYQQSIAVALRALSDSGTRIYLMHGNRDFLLGKVFCQQAGCHLLNDPCVVELNGEQVLLMHGDSLCTTDLAYMRLRKVLRNPLSSVAVLRRSRPLSRLALVHVLMSVPANNGCFGMFRRARCGPSWGMADESWLSVQGELCR